MTLLLGVFLRGQVLRLSGAGVGVEGSKLGVGTLLVDRLDGELLLTLGIPC